VIIHLSGARSQEESSMPVVLCFGNPDIPEDAVAVELGRSLDVPGFTFVHLSSPEEIVDYVEEDVYVMDVAQGIDEVTLITDPSRVVPPPRITAHDLDPALFLRLVEQLYGVAIPIIALPMGRAMTEVNDQVLKLISTLPSGSGPRRRYKGHTTG